VGDAVPCAGQPMLAVFHIPSPLWRLHYGPNNSRCEVWPEYDDKDSSASHPYPVFVKPALDWRGYWRAIHSRFLVPDAFCIAPRKDFIPVSVNLRGPYPQLFSRFVAVHFELVLAFFRCLRPVALQKVFEALKQAFFFFHQLFACDHRAFHQRYSRV
jgi:hypothetical protein